MIIKKGESRYLGGAFLSRFKGFPRHQSVDGNLMRLKMGQRMRSVKRKVVLTTVLGIAAAAAAVPMVVSGTASAQEGSRLCGYKWTSLSTEETVTKIFEVGKDDSVVCQQAMEAQNLADTPYASQLKDQAFDSYVTNTFSFVVCETWKERFPWQGGYLGKTLVNPDRSPVGDQNDICKNMNRSDKLGEMERYWVFFNGDASNPLVELNRI